MLLKNRRAIIISRRRFMQTGAAAATGVLLAACSGNFPPDEDPPQEEVPSQQDAPAEAVAQQTATPTQAVEVQPTATTTSPSGVSQAPTEEPALAPIDTPTLEPTPQCDDHDETPAQTAGPFYTPDTPERTSLIEEGMPGTKLVVSGRVLTTTCEPVAGAILDFWHADDSGEYDNTGYRLRGHQFTDENGIYRLETILPGLYPGRTRHIHVKVQGPTTSLLTTQIYFPDEARNQNDGIFHPALLMAVDDTAEGNTALFDFVLA